MPLVVIDGGGSHARALWAGEDGGLQATARCPGRAVDGSAELERVLVRLLGSLQRAAAAGETGLDPGPGLHVVAGLAGAGRPAGQARARAALQRAAGRLGLPLRSSAVCTDAELALRAVRLSPAPGPTAVLLAGTGAIAWATDGHGHSARAGGLGRFLDDAGSGLWIGAQALTLTARHLDGRAPQARALAQAILGRLRLPDLDDLVQAAPRLWASPATLAALAPTVLALAAAGDGAAASLQRQAAAHLAALARAARGALLLPPSVPLGLGGGLLTMLGPDARPQPTALARAVRRCLATTPLTEVAPLAVPPAVGTAYAWLHAHIGPGAAARLRQQTLDPRRLRDLW